ncbi:hypothetical protein [Nesterenkonia marinintestina]|uniref:hypothetical protein n=1 Tax=Nesterenkonia marinintestina TaxID=2979865 RepID=UPI0021BE53A8|nr:hypothetical protein [Nesterenkonia sp. GX14115]
MPSPEQNRQLTVRPMPRLVPFLAAGVGAAFVVAVIVVLSTGRSEDYSMAASIGYVTFVLSLPGLTLGAVAWLLLERRSRGRGREVTARRVEDRGRDADRPDHHGEDR